MSYHPPQNVLLGTLTVAQTAIVAIGAGWRKVTVTVPTSLGVTTGMSIILLPNGSLTDGYSVATNAYVASSTSIETMVSAPLLAIGANYSFQMRVIKLGV